MERGDLQRVSKDELIDLVLRLQRPEKTSRTSSKPPATVRKERRDKARPGGVKPGHEGKARAMSETFDRQVDHRPDQCPCCQAKLSQDLPAETASEYESIELPEIYPVVERHRRLSVRCSSCGMVVAAPLPDAAKCTPFGPRIHAVATYLKTFQALSYDPLQGAFADLFGLTISQDGLMNMLRRSQTAFAPERDMAIAALRRAKVIGSDETGVRIEGSNAYRWVFRSSEAVVHRAAPTRGAVVVCDLMDGHRPEVWCSDRYSAQQRHGQRHQARLAHFARDVAYADQASDDILPSRLRLWLKRAFALADGIETFAASMIATKCRDLGRSLTAILAAPTTCDLARDLQMKFQRARGQLLTFAAYPGLVEPTNNACERVYAWRPALRRSPTLVRRPPRSSVRVRWDRLYGAAR